MKGRPWTEAELTLAKQMRLLGHTNRSIAEKLGRSFKALENKLYGHRKGRECSTCGVAILNVATTGLCRPCYLAKHNADPQIRARIVAGNAANPDMAAGGAARKIAGRKGSITRWSNPEYRERMTAVFKEKVMHRGSAPDVVAARDWEAVGRAVSETRLAWCPPEYRSAYRELTRKMLGAGEAKRIIKEQIAADRKRAEANLSPFERQMKALEKGARLVANDIKPSLANPGVYEERKAG